MPHVKLSRADKRAIFEAMHADEPAAVIAKRHKITPQYVRKLYRDAINSYPSEYSFLPCWQCGNEIEEEQIFCCSTCERAYKLARPNLYPEAAIDAIPEYDLLDE